MVIGEDFRSQSASSLRLCLLHVSRSHDDSPRRVSPVCDQTPSTLHLFHAFPTSQQSLSFSSGKRPPFLILFGQIPFYLGRPPTTPDDILPVLTPELIKLTMRRLGNGVGKSIALNLLRPEPEERVVAEDRLDVLDKSEILQYHKAKRVTYVFTSIRKTGRQDEAPLPTRDSHKDT